MKYFHGENAEHSFFEGWYFKQTDEAELLAFIPGMNVDEYGKKEAFIQIISNEGSSNISYSFRELLVSRDRFLIKIGENEFSDKGVKIHIENKDISCIGQIEYSKFCVPAFSIMGPFRFIPFMECHHEIISMMHRVKGHIALNGRNFAFDRGLGYIEKDWGSSFPEKYTWIQCNDFSGRELSLMLSIAKIPFIGKSFTGCICAIYYEGVYYRLATYSNVQILKWDRDEITLKQGEFSLNIQIETSEGHALNAPSKGNMTRIINENVSGKANFRFMRRDTVIFDENSENVSFEWV